MKLNKDNMQYPILLGYPTASGKQYACWCPYCFKFHYHGKIGGWRVAHCVSPHSPFRESGYYIKPVTSQEMELSNTRSAMHEEDYPRLKIVGGHRLE